MAITARELVFFIRAENQASGVLRKVARDLRALPSTKQLKVQQAAAQQTVKQVNSGQRVISLAKQELDLKGKSLATQKAMVDAQLRQATIAQRYNSVQAATAANAKRIVATQNRVDAAADKLGSMPQAAADLKSQQAVKQAEIQQQIDRNRKQVKDAEQAARDAQAKVAQFPVASPAARTITAAERQAATVQAKMVVNARQMEQAQTALANAQARAARVTTPSGYIPDSYLKQIQVAQAEVSKLDDESGLLAKELDEVRIKAAEAAKTLTAGMESAERALASAEEQLALVSNQTEILSEKEIQLSKDATAAGEAQVRAANAARAAYEIAAAQLELYRVKQLELANSMKQVQLKADAEAIAIRAQIEAASAAKIEVITNAFNKLGRTAQIAGLLVGAAVGVAAHSAASFESTTTLAATQARPVGAPISSTANIQVQINAAILKQMKEFPAASKDMADSFYEIFSGTNVQSVAKASSMLKTFNMMAVAGGTDLKTMTDAGISLYNNFPNEFKNMTQAANAFFAAVRYARTTPAQFANSLSNVLPVAKAAGRTFTDVADAMALITRQSSGRVTSRDSTGLARLIEMFSRKDVIDGLKTYGINAEQANGKLKPLLTLVTDIYNKFVATGKLKPGPDTLNFFKTISAAGSTSGSGTAGTIQGRRVFDYLLTNIKQYQAVSKQVNSDNDEFVKSFNALSKSPGVKWAVLTNQLKALVIVIGEQAIPAFVKIGEPIVKLLKWFNDLSDSTKKDIAQWMVYGSVGVIVGGFFLRISAAVARWILLAKLSRAASANTGLAQVGSEAGFVSAKMGLALGAFGLFSLLMIKYPQQTMAVINALGGMKTVLVELTAAFIGFKLGPLIAGWASSLGLFVSGLGKVKVATAEAGAQLVLLEGEEAALVVETGVLDAALALLSGPAAIGAIVALAIGGFYLLSQKEDEATRSAKNLKSALDAISSSTLALPTDKLNRAQDQLDVRSAQKTLSGDKKGTLQYAQDLLTLIRAQAAWRQDNQLVLQDFAKNKKGIHDAQQSLTDYLNNLKKQNAAPVGIGINPAAFAPTINADAAEKTLTYIDQLAKKSGTLPIVRRNLLLIEEAWEALGHMPSQKEMKILWNNQNVDAQLRDFVKNIPVRDRQAFIDAGFISGTTLFNAIQAGLLGSGPLTPPDLPTPTTDNSGRHNIPMNATEKQAAAAQKAAAAAAANARYMTQLRNVASLQTAYNADTPGSAKGLADYNALQKALNNINSAYKDYAGYTTDYLNSVEQANDKVTSDTTKKAKTAAEKAAAAAKAAANSAKTTWTQAATTLQSTYNSMFTTNQSNFGTLFQGPFVNSPAVQNRLQWGGKLSGSDLLMDLKSQVKQFRDYNNMVKKLARMNNVPFALVQQLEAAGPAAIDEVRALLSLPKNQLQQYFKTYKQGQSLVEKVTQDQFKLDVSHYKTLGKNIALAIIQGLQSVGTPKLGWFEDLIKSWFPQLAKNAGGAPKVVTKGPLKGTKPPKKLPKPPKVPKTTPHKVVTRRVQSATTKAQNAIDWGGTATAGVNTLGTSTIRNNMGNTLYLDPKVIGREIALATKKEFASITIAPKKDTKSSGNNHPIEEHVHYHVDAPGQESSIEAQLRRAHFVQRNKLRLDKS